MKKTEEERSYALHFFIAVLFLIITFIWLIGWETKNLRPWKDYQKKYYKLVVEQLKDQLGHRTAEFSSAHVQKEYKSLKSALEKAKADFGSPALQAEYKKTKKELEGVADELKRVRHEFQMVRARYLEAEYNYIKYGKEKEKKRLAGLEGEIAILDKKIRQLESNRGTYKAILTKATVPLDQLKRKLNDYTADMDNLKNRGAFFSTKKIEIKQIHLSDLERTDRCQSCHIGIDETQKVSSNEPFTAHPGKELFLGRHAISEFGCTSCHRGQGRATSSASKGHGDVKHWDHPMLRGNNVQASCLVCHENVKALRGAEGLSFGIKTLERKGCYGCHKIAGYEDTPKIGPVLSGLATKVNYTWVKNWIKDPKSVFPTARMPKFGLSDEESGAIADYLFKLNSDYRDDAPAKDPDWNLSDKGKIIFSEARCSICHPAKNKGGAFKDIYAPDLTRVGSKVRIEWLKKWFKDPQNYFPKTRMPRFRFTDGEIDALAEYIMGEFIDYDIEDKKLKKKERIGEQQIKAGARLIEKYGCFGCHDIKGMEKAVKIGPYLKKKDVVNKIGADISSIGTKPFDRFDRGRIAGEVKNRESYLRMKLKSPRIFRDGLLMPNFGFDEKEIDSLVIMLLGFTAEEVPLKYKVRDIPSDYKPTGDFSKIENELKCLTCHTIKGVGGGFAPDLSIEGDKVQIAWLRDFLKNPDIIRPMLQQMPKFKLGGSIGMIRGHLSDDEIAVIVNYITNVLVSSDIPDEYEMKIRLEDVNAAEGRALYMEKGCQACHQIGAAGGGVGPNLTHVGSRLRPGYIFMHVKDPQRMVPGAVEPSYNLGDPAVLKITKFLMSLKK
ncbi:MAG: c-type cytochrome [Desulfobacterales bacterium]|nr:c-type cytochrome [Desulfobacterales bacterium]